MYCSVDCLRWQQEVDIRTAAEIAEIQLKTDSQE